MKQTHREKTMKKYRQGIRISIVALLAALAAGTLSYALDPEVTERSTGLIPSGKETYIVEPKRGVLSGSQVIVPDVLPEKYRSDEQPWAEGIRVKDQKRSGTCWVFNVTTSMEYSYAKEMYDKYGLTGQAIELSPAHIACFFHNRVNDPLGNTENDYNSYNNSGYHWAIDGGDELDTMIHLAGWSGPGAEANTPFDEMHSHIKSGAWDGSDFKYDDKYAYDDAMKLEEAVYINNIETYHISYIKALVLKYGAVCINTDINYNYFNPAERVDYYDYGRSFYNENSSLSANHAVTLIGWDDTYSRDHFVYKSKAPSRDGAWVIQNSWSTDTHDNGIYYMSYDSIELTGKNSVLYAFDMQAPDTYMYQFFYDGSAGPRDTTDKGFDYCRTTEGTYAANVYVNKTDSPITIDAAGFVEFNSGETAYNINIYTGLTDPADPLSGTPAKTTSGAVSTTTTAVTYTAGFKIAVLNEPVLILPYESFSVVFSFNSTCALGLENSEVINGIRYTAGTEPGQSFYRASDGSWLDMNDHNVCFRIKAFANPYVDTNFSNLTDDNRPSAVEGLLYNGEMQTLINAPSVIPEGYEIKYSTDSGISWSPELPHAKERGEYRILYKYIYSDLESLPFAVTARINKDYPAAGPVMPDISTASAVNGNPLSFTGLSGQEYFMLIDEARPDWTKAIAGTGAALSYYLDSSSEYTLYVRTAETENVYAGTPSSISFVTAAESCELKSNADDYGLIGSRLLDYIDNRGDTTYWYLCDDENGANARIEKTNYYYFELNDEHYGKYCYVADFTSGIEVGRTEIVGPITYASIVFNSKGGSQVQAQTNLKYNDKAVRPDDPERGTDIFAGWYVDKDFKKPWNFGSDTIRKINNVLYAKWTNEPLCSYSGIVYDHNGSPASGATVKVLRSGSTIASVNSDPDGRFTLSGLEKGSYQLFAGTSSCQYSAVLELKDNVSDVSIRLPEDRVNAVILTGRDFYDGSLVDGMDDIVQNIVIGPDEYINIRFTIVTEDQITTSERARFDADKTSIAAIDSAKGQSFEFFSMGLTKYYFDGDSGDIIDIGDSNDVILKIIVPISTKGKSNVIVYRCHNGAAEAMKKDPAAGQEGYSISEDQRSVIIYAKKFSTYAVGSGGSSGGGDSGSGGGDSGGGTPSGGGGGSSAASKATGSAVTGPAITTLISPDILKAGMPVQIFTDVEAERWSKDAIDFVIQRGIFSGNGDGTFRPSEPLSRGMAAQIFYNLAGRPAAGSKTSFADSDKFLWFEDAISWAAEKGLINGLPGGIYDPDGSITREQAAAILYRFASACGYDTKARAELIFLDAGSVRSYSYDALSWAVAAGLINGDNGRLLPDEPLTREQMAVVMMRFIQKFAE